MHCSMTSLVDESIANSFNILAVTVKPRNFFSMGIEVIRCEHDYRKIWACRWNSLWMQGGGVVKGRWIAHWRADASRTIYSALQKELNQNQSGLIGVVRIVAGEKVAEPKILGEKGEIKGVDLSHHTCLCTTSGTCRSTI